MRYSKISWAASFDLPLKCTKAANVDHDILVPLFPSDASPLARPQPALGASFASIATSSPIEVRTMTSTDVREIDAFGR